MSVFAFADVWSRGHPLLFGSSEVRLPTVAGYAALKLKAWVDRSAHGEFKDAQDLACAMHWYQRSEAVAQRLYETEIGLDLLTTTEFDADRAANRLLVTDVLSELAAPRRSELRDVWRSTDDELLGDHLLNSALPAWPIRYPARRMEFVEDVRQVIDPR